MHVDDLARICVDASDASDDIVIDAAGPETMPFRDLVALVRSALHTNAPILRIPPQLMAAAARALGLLVGDVVLTSDEIRGLMAGLLVSPEPPLGQIVFSHWLNAQSTTVGRTYANEIHRHFAKTSAAGWRSATRTT